MPEVTGYEPEGGVTKEHIEGVRRSRELLAVGKEFRQSNREDAWRQSEAQYEGHHWESTALEDPTADLITINVSFSTVNTIIPYVTSEEPRFLVEPYSADASAKNARLQQALLNRAWRTAEGQAAIRAAAEDYLIYGDGYVKPTYSIETVVEGGTEREFVDLFIDRVSPWDVWMDPFATGLADARWVAQRIVLTRREMEADDRFDQSLIDDLPWGQWRRDKSSGDERDVSPSDESWVELYEFYDKVTSTLYVFTEVGPEKPLRVIEGIVCPIRGLPNYRLPRSPYHMGELEQLWPMQQELNKTRSQLITHRRRNIAKYFYRKGSLSVDAVAALTSPIIAQGIEVLGDQPLDSVVRPAQLAALSPEAYSSADQAMRDIYEISGVNEYLRGATPEIRRTATEASIIEGASNVKTRAKLADIERTVREVGEYLLAIMKEVYPQTPSDETSLFLTGPEAEQVGRADAAERADKLALEGAPVDMVSAAMAEGEDVESVTVEASAEIFVGIYRVEVEQGSTEMRNPMFKEQKYRDMAQALVGMAPALAQSGVTLNLRKVMEMWFEAAGISDVEGMFQSAVSMPQQDPMAAAMGGAGGQNPLAALMGGMGQRPGGTPQGEPNIAGVAAPQDVMTEANSGMMPPTA